VINFGSKGISGNVLLYFTEHTNSDLKAENIQKNKQLIIQFCLSFSIIDFITVITGDEMYKSSKTEVCQTPFFKQTFKKKYIHGFAMCF